MRNRHLLKSVLPAMVLLVLLGSAMAALAQNTAGRVDFATGGVSATATGGVSRPLAKGGLVFSGDTINTDNTGRAQIRFTDGAYMSLQPQTQFRVDDYRYDGAADGKEKGFFSLVKGGLRTITGVIGHANRDSYQVNTPVATIGIRGTEYLANLVNGLELSIGDGSIFVLNKSGKFILEQGQSAFIANQNTVPVLTVNPPSLPPAPVQESSKPPPDPPAFVSGNQVNPSGSSAIIGGGGLGNGLASGPGYALAISQGDRFDTPGVDCAGGINPCGQPIVTLSGGGVSWVQATQSIRFHPGNLSGVNGTATFSGGSAGGVIGWGSFTNGTFITENDVLTLGANEGLHFVVGIPTSPMPTSGTASMSLIGATMPTFSDNAGGGLGTGTVTSGSLTAVFGPGVSIISSTNFNVAFSSGNAYVFSGSGGGQAAGFVGSGGLSKTSGASTVCATSCTGAFTGFFAGPGATFAGYTYFIAGPMPFTINGAVVFH
jgi:FecR protein